MARKRRRYDGTHPCVLLAVTQKDADFSQGVRVSVETLCGDKFRFRTAQAAGRFLVDHGLSVVTPKQLAVLRQSVPREFLEQ
jgi:hypothetical protein